MSTELDPSQSALLQRLADRADIQDVVTRMAVSVDTRDWEMWTSCVTDPVEFRYPDSVGSGTFGAAEMARMGAVFFEGLDATQHLSSNHVITIDGATAACVSTLHAQHFLAGVEGGPVQRQIGYYTNYLRRQDGGWKVYRSDQRVAWLEGNVRVYETAASAFGK